MLTLEEMKKQHATNEGGMISGVIEVEVTDLINNDLEAVMDLFSLKLTGSLLLCNIAYEVVGYTANTIRLQVTGDPAEIFECGDVEEDLENDGGEEC